MDRFRVQASKFKGYTGLNLLTLLIKMGNTCHNLLGEAVLRSPWSRHPIDEFFQPGTWNPELLNRVFLRELDPHGYYLPIEPPFTEESGYLVSIIRFQMAREKVWLEEGIGSPYSGATVCFSWRPTGCLKGFSTR